MSMNLEENSDEEDVVLPLGFPTRSSSPPATKRNYGSSRPKNRATVAAGSSGTTFDFPKRRPNRQTVTEGMALVTPPTSSSTTFFSDKAWRGTATAPMVSGRKTLRLPNLNKSREARRTTLVAANARLMREALLGDAGADRWSTDRPSASSASERNKNLISDSSLLLGEDLLNRRTTSSGRDSKDLVGVVEVANGAPPEESALPTTSINEDLKAAFDLESSPIVLSLLYGVVNTFIVLPVVMSFGSIIYNDDFFRPYLPALMKLTVVSGAVHQIMFSTFSSLPFAVGQVQDAGLIFLSAMATDLVSRLKSEGADDDSILATLTIGLSAYTAVMGFALVLVGKCKLASYCQLLPPSVVGGYLAFIGFFCGQAGLSLMAMVPVSGLADWYKFFNRDALVHLAPGVVGGCAMYYAVRTLRHVAVFPSSIVVLMFAFYVVLWATGSSVQEATDYGWINKTEQAPSWDHTWDFFKVEKVVWSVLPSQTLSLMAMTVVVALSSSLDVAAIEIELKRPLDYNYELKTVGLSNIISGLTGGYTGSYIFSQTIFSMRSGIRSRLCGFVLAFLMLLTVVMPINILAYVPNYFFGSLLMFICLDLLFEWLIDVREKVTSAEYVILLSTFVLLQILGVEFGIIGGVVLYMIIQKLGYDVGKDEEE